MEVFYEIKGTTKSEKVLRTILWWLKKNRLGNKNEIYRRIKNPIKKMEFGLNNKDVNVFGFDRLIDTNDFSGFVK